jgi:regulator of protease activity HflC (stomatin/prohibitin superfamily)
MSSQRGKFNNMKKMIPLLFLIPFLTQCTIIRPGEVGIKQRFGKLNKRSINQGMVSYNPFSTKVIKASTQTQNLRLDLNLPSKEGLSVKSLISILYRLERDSVGQIINNYGLDYEPLIGSIFRSAASDVCAKYYAKDMHSGKRANIEESIKNKMVELLNGNGILIQSVLMKSISLPPGLSSSIEQKLQAEQDAMRMEFVLKQEKLEAERRIIEAKGKRDAQKILSQGLTSEIIQLRSIEAFEKLSNSTNGKVIITNGKAPLLID